MNTENGLDTIMMITTDSPRLTVTPGECYASDGTTQIKRDLRHTHDISAAVDCNTVEPNDMIFRLLSLPAENVSAGRDGNCRFSTETFWRLVFSHEWFIIHLQRDEVELEMNSEPRV